MDFFTKSTSKIFTCKTFIDKVFINKVSINNLFIFNKKSRNINTRFNRLDYKRRRRDGRNNY